MDSLLVTPSHSVESKVSEEDRKFLMGHKKTSRMFSAYNSRFALVGFAWKHPELPPAEEEVVRHSSCGTIFYGIVPDQSAVGQFPIWQPHSIL